MRHGFGGVVFVGRLVGGYLLEIANSLSFDVLIIAWEFSELREKYSDGKIMSVLCEASGLVREIAAPATGKAALLKVYRRLRTWSYSRVKDIYYADRRCRISAEEMDELREIAGNVGIASCEPSLAELRDQLAVVVRHLRAIDPTFAYPWAEIIGDAAHLDRGEAGSTDCKVGKFG